MKHHHALLVSKPDKQCNTYRIKERQIHSIDVETLRQEVLKMKELKTNECFHEEMHNRLNELNEMYEEEIVIGNIDPEHYTLYQYIQDYCKRRLPEAIQEMNEALVPYGIRVEQRNETKKRGKLHDKDR